jgi:hypothetical protein
MERAVSAAYACGMLRFQGIADSFTAEVREKMVAPEYGHPAHRSLAQGYGPCRQCLRTFAIGRDERILFTYQPFREADALPAPGPVFIHAEACERYDAPALPPDLCSLPLVFEAYADGARLLAQERIGTGASEEILSSVFERTGADYVHIRNGKVGCFIARVTRP